RSDAGPSRRARSRPRRRHVRSNGAVDRELRGLGRGDRSSTRCSRARRSSRRRSRGATSCSAARRNATTATATADPAKIRCSPISPPAISERPPIRCFLTMRKIAPTHAALSPIRRDRHSSTAAWAVFSPKPICSASPRQWMRDGFPSCPDNQRRFRVPTLRNVDKRPYPTFVKAYGHNGYFKSPKSIVHFYNTRDVLPRCQPNDPGEGTTCWPAPESTANMNTKRMGRLSLSDAEEDALVSFMQTLTDGFLSREQR